MLVIVLEIGRDLLPQLFKGRDLGSILFPVLIVMGVDDCVHTVVHAVIYDFLDSCQIVVTDCAVERSHIRLAALAGHIPPGDRDADGIEASLLDFFDHVLGSNHIAPCSLDLAGGQRAVPGVCGIQSVAQIPAQTHIIHQFYCGLFCRRGGGHAGRQCRGHRQTDGCRGHGAEQFLHKLHAIVLLHFLCAASSPPYAPATASPYPPYSTTFCASCQEIFANHMGGFSTNRQNAQIMFRGIV